MFLYTDADRECHLSLLACGTECFAMIGLRAVFIAISTQWRPAGLIPRGICSYADRLVPIGYKCGGMGTDMTNRSSLHRLESDICQYGTRGESTIECIGLDIRAMIKKVTETNCKAMAHWTCPFSTECGPWMLHAQ